MQAAEAYLKAKNSLPVNIKLLLEGQEEIGSPNLADLLKEHKDLLSADMALSADGGQINEKQVMYSHLHGVSMTAPQDLCSACPAEWLPEVFRQMFSGWRCPWLERGSCL